MNSMKNEENKIFLDEHGRFQMDFSEAIWATDKLHKIFCTLKDNILNDVDFVVEDNYNLFFIEYKNSNVKTEGESKKFNPIDGEGLRKVARKYFDSLNFIRTTDRGIQKKKIYIYILETKHKGRRNNELRKYAYNRLRDRLPFKFKNKSESQGIMMIETMIDNLKVLSIQEWNEEYKQFPAKIISEN